MRTDARPICPLSTSLMVIAPGWNRAIGARTVESAGSVKLRFRSSLATRPGASLTEVTDTRRDTLAW